MCYDTVLSQLKFETVFRWIYDFAGYAFGNFLLFFFCWNTNISWREHANRKHNFNIPENSRSNAEWIHCVVVCFLSKTLTIGDNRRWYDIRPILRYRGRLLLTHLHTAKKQILSQKFNFSCWQWYRLNWYKITVVF